MNMSIEQHTANLTNLLSNGISAHMHKVTGQVFTEIDGDLEGSDYDSTEWIEVLVIPR